MVLWQKFAPWLCAITVPLFLGGSSLLTQKAFDNGMEIPIFLLYKNAIASIVLVPLVIKYRSTLPPLTGKIVFQIITMGILGPGLEGIAHAGSKLTPAVFGACISSLVPPFTFLSSWIFRLETMHIQERASQAKLLGTIIMTTGAIVSGIYGIYGGPVIAVEHTPSHPELSENWVRGPFLLLISLLIDVAYNMLLDRIVKNYPAPLALAAYLCCIGTAINMGYALIWKGTSGLEWLWGINIKLGTYLYNGLFVSGLTIYLQGWLTKLKGPIFFISFSPLSTVFIIVVGTLFLKDKLKLGMLIGAVMIILGLGIFLWGESQGSSSDVDENQEPEEMEASSRHHSVEAQEEEQQMPIMQILEETFEDDNSHHTEEAEASSGGFHIAELFEGVEEDEGQPSKEGTNSGSTLEDDDSHHTEEAGGSSGGFHIVELFEGVEEDEGQPSMEATNSGSTLEDDDSRYTDEVKGSSGNFHIVELFERTEVLEDDEGHIF